MLCSTSELRVPPPALPACCLGCRRALPGASPPPQPLPPPSPWVPGASSHPAAAGARLSEPVQVCGLSGCAHRGWQWRLPQPALRDATCARPAAASSRLPRFPSKRHVFLFHCHFIACSAAKGCKLDCTVKRALAMFMQSCRCSWVRHASRRRCLLLLLGWRRRGCSCGASGSRQSCPLLPPSCLLLPGPRCCCCCCLLGCRGRCRHPAGVRRQRQGAAGGRCQASLAMQHAATAHSSCPRCRSCCCRLGRMRCCSAGAAAAWRPGHWPLLPLPLLRCRPPARCRRCRPHWVAWQTGCCRGCRFGRCPAAATAAGTAPGCCGSCCRQARRASARLGGTAACQTPSAACCKGGKGGRAAGQGVRGSTSLGDWGDRLHAQR